MSMFEDVEMMEDVDIQEPEENEAVSREELLFNEDELLKALTSQENTPNTEIIEVKYGDVIFRFRIRPLSEREYDECRERHTKYKRNRRLGGMKVVEDTDTVGYHTSLIYTATVDADKERLWKNKRLWKAVGALTATDMVDKLIPLAGKKQQIIERIEKLSGYDDETEEEFSETVKN